MEPYVGQLLLWGGNYAPYGWAFCEGQLMSISQNTALFSLLGNTYGGDGRTTFALPDLRGRAVCGISDGAAPWGQTFGESSYQMTQDQMPTHTHQVTGTVGMGCNSKDQGDQDSPENGYYKTMKTALYADSGNIPMGASKVSMTVDPTGSSADIPISQPSLGLTYCIALRGIFPQRP